MKKNKFCCIFCDIIIIVIFCFLFLSIIYSNINIYNIIYNYSNISKLNKYQFLCSFLILEIIVSILNILFTIILGMIINIKIKNYYLKIFLILMIFAFIMNLITVIILFYHSDKGDQVLYIISILKEIVYLIIFIFFAIIHIYYKKQIKKNEKIILKTDDLSEKIYKALAVQQQKIISQKNENTFDISSITLPSNDYISLNSEKIINFN